MATYYLGNQVTLTFTITDSGVLVDPGTITFALTDPSGAVTTPALTHVSTGTYSYSAIPTLTGNYPYTLTTTGAGAGKTFGFFSVVSGQVTLSTVTFQDVVDQVDTILHGYSTDLEQVCASGSMTSTDLTFTVDDATQVTAGLIQVDSELMWVKTVDRNASTVHLSPFGRGFQGTTAAAHAANSMVVNNPKFPRQHIKTSVQQVINAIYPSIFQVKQDESQTAKPGRVSYQVPSDCDIVRDVSWRTIGPSELWKPVQRWRFRPVADSTDFPTGKAIDIGDPVIPGRTLKITYIAAPGQLNNESDTLGMAGLDDSSKDILTYGACYRLLTGIEASRLQTNTVTQASRDALVPAGAATNASKYYFALYNQRLHDEALRLQMLYPASIHKTR